MEKTFDIIIIGGGFTGLTAALDLTRAGKKVLILESDATPGGLAGTFEFKNGVTIEKFYHHWFNNDLFVPELVRELGMQDQIVVMPSRTGMYFNGKHWRLSSPLDLLKFKPLPFLDRIRLGLSVLKVRKTTDWKSIEHLSIKEWLEPLCGKNAYRVMWEPLIKAKFSVFADAINAVWMWNKLVLRGGTRDAKGGEQLMYFRGGFGRLAQAMADEIIKRGGEIRYNSPVARAQKNGDELVSVTCGSETFSATQFLFTPAFPIIADILNDISDETWLTSLRRVNYLSNMCLVLELNKSLSDTYWLNVNDPGFPFVGVIEHTNFDPPEHYRGKHIVFLSRYLAKQDPLWSYTDEQYLTFALDHVKKMFPEFDRSWVDDYRVWRAEYGQPVTERHYSDYVPPQTTPFKNAWIATMAHVYPEDRGTNYAIREGRAIAKKLLAS